MFTGLIEDLGKVKEIINQNGGKLFLIELGLDCSDIKIGDSIAINGACQTVIKKEANILTFEAMKETLNRTNFNYLKIGDFVNIERAMKINSRLDGHLVSGHIDCISKLNSIKNEGVAKIFNLIKNEGVAKIFNFSGDTTLIVEKGSISINGISLTVSKVSDNNFEVSILPYTFQNTNLKYLKQNDVVNIEYDMVAKYIKKF